MIKHSRRFLSRSSLLAAATILAITSINAQGGGFATDPVQTDPVQTVAETVPGPIQKTADSAGMPAQSKPVFTGKAAAGDKAGSERWIVHFKTPPYSLDAYRAEMLGARNPDRVDILVAEIERRMTAGRAGFVKDIEALGGTVTAQWWIVNAAAFQIAPNHLAAIRKLENVAYLEPDVIHAPLIKTATNSSNHNSDALNLQGFTGANVGVAIIDSSFDDNMNNTGKVHITFSRRGSSTLNRFCHKQRVGSRQFDDPHPHGTGVASVAAGWRWRTSTADSGMAYDANFACFSIASFSNGSAFRSSMATSYNAIAGIAARCRVRVSNLSYGGSPNPLAVEQKAMDSLALNTDIVNCTAAGNSGTNVNGSLTNINGLSVGAVNENSHTLAGFSGRGFQSGRYFPNICANGVSTNMARQNNENSDYISNGTSMASPMVTGGAALIRGINTALKADETIAILLAGTEANSGSTSTIKVNGVGAGYMKLDASRDIARNSNRHGRATLTRVGQTFTRQINVVARQRIQCAVKWLRHNINSTSWANLDLALLRGSTVIVNSNTLVNTEEFVRFTATRSEVLTMRVTLVSFGSGQSRQTFGWACNATTGAKPGKYTLFGAGCKGSGTAPGVGIVVPKAYRTKMGQSSNTFPHARAKMRYQQVFLAADFGGADTFNELCLRRDERFGGPAQTQRITIKMGHTLRNHTNITTSFAGNYTGPVTTVVVGTLNLPGRTGGGTINSFDVCMKFTRPFVYNGTQNVLVELINTSTSSRSHFEDFCTGSDCTTTRLYAFSATASTATSLFRNQGLVMRFGGSPVGVCTVLPSAFRTKMGSGANTFPHARANMRYHQVFLRSEVGLTKKTFNELCLRKDERSGGPAQSQTLTVQLGYTRRNHTNLSTSFATNIDSGALTTVFSGTVNLPLTAGGGNVNSWQPCIKFSRPFVWDPARIRNFLVEIRNTSRSSRSHFEDFCTTESGSNTKRVWALSATAATGATDPKTGGLIMCFRGPNTSTGVNPLLGNIGVPVLGRTFRVTLKQARVNSAGIVWLGARANTPLPGGCTLLATPLLQLGVIATGTSGGGSLSIAIPNARVFFCLKFSNQIWVLDPQGAFLNILALTNGGEGVIGG